MNFTLPLLMTLLPAAVSAQLQSGGTSVPQSPPVPKTTEVLVIETPKQGVTFQQIIAVMPEEIRATVQLYLDGQIDVDPFISHRITLDQVNHGFELMEAQDGIRSVIEL